MRFKYTIEKDDDTHFFAFSQPIPFTEILHEIHDKEKTLLPK